MVLTNEQLRSIPLFAGMTDEALTRLRAAFEDVELPAGTVLCRAADQASEFYVLARGRVSLSDGDRVTFELTPPASIGELGALCNLARSVDVTVRESSVIWRIGRDALLDLLKTDSDIGSLFYQNLAGAVADKLRRDQLRMQDMRHNLIATQRQMKDLRTYVLESEDTPVSDRVHDVLVDLIDHNRRINYRVTPPGPLPATVHLDGCDEIPILELSRTHFSFLSPGGAVPNEKGSVAGVMMLGGPEIPIVGKVHRVLGDRVTIELGDLIDDYAAILEGYLSRVQMVDFVV
ncbi:MAG: cyclic nucleotide-binding domain-containing protein [Deltaproteobacteria bacterium]|nr:cyclic nucleotide-binding domain-containing protein [Deltaproteobacteria bacterium]